MAYSYQAVERLPKQLATDTVYHSEEFELAALLCACGCGHRVVLLVPDGHQVTAENGLATVHPSIAVCDAACKSHYFITAGRVEWLAKFSAQQASAVMNRQIARHISHDLKQRTWYDRARAAIALAIHRLKSMLGI